MYMLVTLTLLLAVDLLANYITIKVFMKKIESGNHPETDVSLDRLRKKKTNSDREEIIENE